MGEGFPPFTIECWKLLKEVKINFAQIRRVLSIIVPLFVVAITTWGCRPNSNTLDDEPIDLAVFGPPLMPIEHAGNSDLLLTVSAETTFVTSPLDDEAYVDYVGAINRNASEGVTTDNNAAVLFAKAGLGWRDLSPELRNRFFELLGIEQLTEVGPYFTRLSDVSNFEDSQLVQATSAPWAANEFPVLSEWLNSNDAPLEMVIEGTFRSRCYVPMIAPNRSTMVHTVNLGLQQESRAVAAGLAARAMRRLHDGQLVLAEQDLLACHRFARHIGQTEFLICGIVGFSIERKAVLGDIALMRNAKLTSHDALTYQAELRDLPTLPVMANAVDFGERISCLDSFVRSFRKRSLHELSDQQIQNLRTANNEGLHVISHVFGRVAAAGRLPFGPRRTQELDLLYQALHGVTTELVEDSDTNQPVLKSPEVLTDYYQSGSPVDIGRKMGKGYVCLMMPAYSMSYNFENRANMQHLLSQVGFALAAFRKDRGAFPTTLTSLVPNYISEVPSDLFSGRELHYMKNGDGFQIYSVGENGIDDHGRVSDSQPLADDVSLQISGNN